jgi:hypothetical protein
MAAGQSRTPGGKVTLGEGTNNDAASALTNVMRGINAMPGQQPETLL